MLAQRTKDPLQRQQGTKRGNTSVTEKGDKTNKLHRVGSSSNKNKNVIIIIIIII